MNRTVIAAVPLLAALVLAGCGILPGGGRAPATPHTAPAVSAKPGDLTGGRHYRAGWVGQREHAAKIDVHRVERYASYSVLHMDLYTGPGATSFTGWFGNSALSDDFGSFALLDPVGKRYYRSLRADAEDGEAFGTRIEDAARPGIAPSITAQPGVRYPVEVYFPPIPAGAGAITVLAPGTFGELTGIPVLNTGKAQAPVPKANDNSSGAVTPKPGQVFFYPVRPPKGRIWSQVQDLHDYVEGLEKTTSSGGGEEKIALRTDVLFTFDKANLSAKATAVLDDAVDQTRAQADPAKPPIAITGYTDAKGGDAYNMKLSVRRAKAVEKYISGKLGAGYRYHAAGKGEADPISANTHDDGSDNPQGRAKNRRVEIGYKIKQRRPASSTRQSATPGQGAVGANAPYRAGDGPVIGSVRMPQANPIFKARLDVHPFYRDGAYMVGVFNLHNLGSTLQDLQLGLGDSETTAMRYATLGGVTATDPVGKVRYYDTRRGDVGAASGETSFVEGDVGFLNTGMDDRLYVYYPAPPANVTKVDVKAGDWGTVKNVPVQ